MIYKIERYLDDYELPEYKNCTIENEIYINTKSIDSIEKTQIFDEDTTDCQILAFIINGRIIPITCCFEELPEDDKTGKKYNTKMNHASDHFDKVFDEIISIMKKEALK